MGLAATTRALRPGRRVAFAGFLVGAIWTFGGILPLGTPHSDPLKLPDQVRVTTFSAMLASFALAAWVIVSLARPSRWVFVMAALAATGGVVAGIGNFAEDGLLIAGAEYVYGLGFFMLLIGLVLTTIVLVVRREVVPVLLVALSLVGLVLAAGHGPNLVPVVWFGLAAWVLVRRPAVVHPA